MIDQLIINARSQRQQSSANSGPSDKTLRSIVKTISWRVIGTIDTVIISWVITGTLALAFSIGMVELFTKMALYFFHERFWNRVNWGK